MAPELPLARQIERDIYSDVLAPGMWLKQIDMERRYGCTRLTLRHALEQLQARDVVKHMPNRGFYVPEIDLERVREIFEARAYVETSVAAPLVANATPEILGELSFLATKFADSVRTGTILQQDAANLAFHRKLLTLLDNQTMADIIWDLRTRVPLAVQRRYNTPAKMERAALEHFEMIEALRNGDSQQLRTVIARHVGMAQLDLR